MSVGWLSPSMMKSDVVAGAKIIEPDELAGRLVVAVEAEMCLEPESSGAVCGLVRNHRGDHWLCSRELAEGSGPFALVRVDQ
jgi:hypothetical protein